MGGSGDDCRCNTVKNLNYLSFCENNRHGADNTKYAANI